MKYPLLVFLFSISLMSTAQTIGEFAQSLERRGPVSDFAELLSPHVEKHLTDMISKETGISYSICLIKDLRNFQISNLSREIGQNWQSGATSENFAVLILISQNEKAVSITTSKKLRASLPDSLIQAIMNQDVSPEFKKGNYYTGISTTIDQLQYQVEQNWFLSGDKDSPNSDNINTVLAVVFFVIIVVLFVYDQYRLSAFNPDLYNYGKDGRRRSGLLGGPDKYGNYSEDDRDIYGGRKNGLPW